MSNTFELNSISLKNDGIIIYQRPDTKNRNWQVRIRIPDSKEYVIKSLGTNDLEKAKYKAEELWDNLRLKFKSSGHLKTLKINDIYPKFVEWLKLNSKSQERVSDICRVFNLYFIQYFKDKDLYTLKNNDIQEFIEWRIKNPVYNKKSKRKVAPTNTTIRKEIISIKQFIKWCKSNQYIKNDIEIKSPPASLNRRPHFDSDEWSIITRNMREWVKDKVNHRDRLYLTQYMLILANTGIRVGEARTLKWMDIQNQERIENGKVINDLILWVKGKTGKRDVVAKSSDVSEYLKRLFEYRSNELQKQTNGKIIKPNKNEPVFCNENGNAILSFKKSYKHFLESVGLLKNANGDTRTIYSLRHTYATFRLMNGVDSYVLSKNLGTSVKMIELHYGHTTNRGFASELTKNKSMKKENRLPWE